MPRLAIRRRGAAAALVAAALLSSCTDTTGGTDGGPSGPTAAPAVAEKDASSTATTVVEAAITSRSDTGADGVAAREEAFTGPALESANAWAKTLPARSPAEKADNALSSTAVTVVGVSRAGDSPRQILAQTTREKDGGAVLALLVAPDEQNNFKVAALAPVLPDAKLDALDPLTVGSAAIADGAGLAAEPDAVVAAFASSVQFPDPTSTTVLAPDPISEKLRASAAAQSKAIAARGTFTQTHEPTEVIGGLRLKDGAGAVVFAGLVRSDSIALREAGTLTPAKDVQLLAGLKKITTEATLRSNEVVAIVIPASGPARVVAFGDQLVGATGR